MVTQFLNGLQQITISQELAPIGLIDARRGLICAFGLDTFTVKTRLLMRAVLSFLFLLLSSYINFARIASPIL